MKINKEIKNNKTKNLKGSPGRKKQKITDGISSMGQRAKKAESS